VRISSWRGDITISTKTPDIC